MNKDHLHYLLVMSICFFTPPGHVIAESALRFHLSMAYSYREPRDKVVALAAPFLMGSQVAQGLIKLIACFSLLRS